MGMGEGDAAGTVVGVWTGVRSGINKGTADVERLHPSRMHTVPRSKIHRRHIVSSITAVRRTATANKAGATVREAHHGLPEHICAASRKVPASDSVTFA
jgi:hypothetical protein